jgi:hypothetical protein
LFLEIAGDVMLLHTTKVRTLTNISRARLLPRFGEVTVRSGAKVKPTQIIARAPAPSGLLVLDAGVRFGMTPADINENLLVREGDNIERGTPLLRKPSRLDRSKVISSPVDGMLTKVYGGNLVIQQTNKMISVRAMIQGKVTTVIPGRGAVIEVLGSLIQAAWDSGKEGFGKLSICTETASDELDSHAIDAETQRSIIVAGMVQKRETLESLEERGTRGLIVGSLAGNLRDKAEEIAYPIFVTDGIGSYKMANPIFDLLQNNAGHDASLLSSKLGGDNLLRSEIIVAQPDASPQRDKELTWKSIEDGDTIRILNGDGSNQLGIVVDAHSQPGQVALGSWAIGADVEISGGEVIFVPYSNMDMII